MSELTPTENCLFAALGLSIKDPNTFEWLAKTELHKAFDDEEYNFLQTWKVIKDLYKRLASAPSVDAVCFELKRQSLPDEFISIFQETFEIVDPQDESLKRVIQTAIRDFLNERVALRGLIQKSSGGIDESIYIYQEEFKKRLDLHNFSAFKPQKLFEIVESEQEALKFIPTGIQFIDSRIDGGLVPGEVAILLGPTKGGKTTLSIQMACSAAKLSMLGLCQDNRKVALATYEDDGRAIAYRIISHLAKIPIKRLIEAGVRNLSTVVCHDYERRLQEFEEKLLPEAKRYENIKWIQDYLDVIDFSGRLQSKSAGTGGVPEIAETLESLAKDKGYKLVIIDWAGVMATRYLENKNNDIKSALPIYLRSLPDSLHKSIASKFNAGVILVHQLAGAANRHQPGSDVGDTEAEHCKSIAFLAWHAMIIRNKDPRTGVNAFVVSRSRRCPPYPPALIKLMGEFGYFEDVSTMYQIDRTTKRIVEKSGASPYAFVVEDEELDDLDV